MISVTTDGKMFILNKWRIRVKTRTSNSTGFTRYLFLVKEAEIQDYKMSFSK